jgi:hypothetical protein
MKGIICKLIITMMTLAALHTGCCCACVMASDGGQFPPPKVPDLRLPNDIEKALNQRPAPSQPIQPAQQAPAGTPVSPVMPVTQQGQPAGVQVANPPAERGSVQQPTTPAQMEQIIRRPPVPPAGQSGGGGFMTAVLNMLSALAKVVLLVFAIAGVYLAYNKLSSQIMHVAVPKSGGKQGSPATVSEAVASYARHRLRKGY